jgi:hypothetical protein
MLHRGVSDHNPLRITFGLKTLMNEGCFKFEKWWLGLEDFLEVVKKAWLAD